MIESLGSLEGKYEILERIGEGGMGAIYKVRHRLINDIRVIKTMRAHLSDRSESRERFFREARLAARVKHENIAQVLDFSMDEDTAFLVMEYIDGVTLLDIFAGDCPPSLPLALEIAQQSLRALAVVHKTGIIHRDISPDNLMLTTDNDGNPKVKLIDLGLAKLTGADSGLTKEGFFLGKLRYAAPEQFQSEIEAPIGTWSDVYSFGLVFYQLVTGRYPIRGRDMTGLMAGHVSLPPLPFSDSDPAGRVPEDLRRAILRSLEKRSEDRFPSGEAFHDQVRLIQTHHPMDQKEKEEAARLSRCVQAKSKEVRASSDQSRIDGAFRPDKSSAGDSHSEDVTEPAENPSFDTGDTAQISAKSEREATRTSTIPPKPIQTSVGKTVIRRSDKGLSGASAEGDSAARTQPPEPRISKATPVGTSTARTERKRPRSKRLWVAAALTIVLVAVIAVMTTTKISLQALLGRDGDPTAQVALVGTLILQVSPWAEVIEIRDASGKSVELNGDRFTPLVLPLAPGVYGITLTNDDYGTRTVEVEISADQTTTETVRLAAISEDDLLRSLGVIE